MFNRIINFFFPIACVGCGCSLPADDYFRICQKCYKKIEVINGYICQKCGKNLPDGGKNCYHCRKDDSRHFEILRSVGEFKGFLRELIHRFKYQNRDYYGRIFGRLFNEIIDKEKIFKEADIIIAVPMHWLKKIIRGYNQAELLVDRISEYLKIPVFKNVLIRNKITRAQFTLNKIQRFKNLENSIKLSKAGGVKGKKILLVDDVATTCATIEQCSLILKKAGANKIYALTIARD